MAGAPYHIRRIKSPTKRTRFGKFGEVAKTIRPVKDEPLQYRKIEVPNEVISRRRGITYTKDFQANLERRAVPDRPPHRGSVHERIIYKELMKRRLDFSFQPAIEGGRQELGGLVADFILYGIGHSRGLVILPHGKIWHTGVFAERRDEYNIALLRMLGFEVWQLWDYEVEDEKTFNDLFRRRIDFAPVRAGGSNVGLRRAF